MSKLDDPSAKQSLPLNSIRVFVEAARQLSFSRAALVLGMTQGGVSRHVARLENHLGHRLFARAGGSAGLTDVGRLYFDNLRDAMATIELTTRQLSNRPARVQRLVVRTSLPTLAVLVLIPALASFVTQPQVQVDVVTSLSPPDPADFYDVLVSRDLVLADAEHWLLSTENLVCVATPAVCLAFSDRPIDTWPFISATSRPDALAAWSRQQGLASGDIHVVASFEHYFLALAAAAGGMGFLVVPQILVYQALSQGQLLETTTPAVRGNADYVAYLNPQSAAPEAASAFCRWLKTLLRGEKQS